jgi:hypothetical protein
MELELTLIGLSYFWLALVTGLVDLGSPVGKPAGLGITHPNYLSRHLGHLHRQ